MFHEDENVSSFCLLVLKLLPRLQLKVHQSTVTGTFTASAPMLTPPGSCPPPINDYFYTFHTLTNKLVSCSFVKLFSDSSFRGRQIRGCERVLTMTEDNEELEGITV